MITSIIQELASLAPQWLPNAEAASAKAFGSGPPQEREGPSLVVDSAGDKEVATRLNIPERPV